MKKSNFIFQSVVLLFMSTLLFVGCSSSDDDNFSFNETPDIALMEHDIVLPNNLVTNSDPAAQELVSEIGFVTTYQTFAYMTIVPPGAEVSHTPIQTGGNSGKTLGIEVDYTVYTYNYGTFTIVYQFSVQNGMQVIEIFYGGPEINGYYHYMTVEQTLDGTEGSMKFFGFDMDYALEWTWEIYSDGSIFITMNTSDSNIYYEMMYYPNESGYLNIYNNGTLGWEYHWNSNGSGNWIDHYTGESGSW